MRVSSPRQKIPILAIKYNNRKVATAQSRQRYINSDNNAILQGRQVLSRSTRNIYRKEVKKNHKQLSKTLNIKSPTLPNNCGDSTYRRINKLGISDYIQRIISRQNEQMTDENLQLLAETLNRTWVDCRRIEPRLQKFSNTLKIKSSSQDLSKIKVQWKNQEKKDETTDWKQQQYIPNYKFPCRKNSKLIRNRYFSNKAAKNQDETKASFRNERINFMDLLKRDTIHKRRPEKKIIQSQRFEKSKTKKPFYQNEQALYQNSSVFAGPSSSEIIKGNKSKLYA